MEKNISEIKGRSNIKIYCIFAIYCFFESNNNLNVVSNEKLLPIFSQLIDENIIKNNGDIVDYILKNFFEYFLKYKKYSEGKNYLLQLIKFLQKLEFHYIKAFALYFAFLGKDYRRLDELLSELIIKTDFKSQEESHYFSLYSFYKGEILLIKEKFILASLSYGYSVIHIINNKINIIDQCQIECIKRLCLLKGILPSDFSNIFNDILTKIIPLEGMKELKPYLEYFKKNDDDPQNFELFIIKNQQDIKKSKIFGLCKIILKELRFKFIQKYLKKFTRIKLTKLSQLTNIQYPTLKNILEWKVCKNKINIKFDEVEDIIEIIDSEIGNSLEELREYYSYLTQISTELYLYDKNKIENFKQFNLLSDEEKQRILLQRKIQVANEDSDDDE
jgi:hypothetical protein